MNDQKKYALGLYLLLLLLLSVFTNFQITFSPISPAMAKASPPSLYAGATAYICAL